MNQSEKRLFLIRSLLNERPSCQKQLKHGMCKNRACLAPEACPNLDADHTDYMMLLRKLRELPKVKKVFIRSGIRFDYLMLDPDDSFFVKLVRDNVSGQLKVAPEHVSDKVLAKMGKPGGDVYQRFVKKYQEAYGETPIQFAADSYDAIYAIKAAAEDAGITPDMSVSDICEALKASMVKVSVDGLTGEGMTWSENGEPTKAPKAIKVEDGAYTAMDK